MTRDAMIRQAQRADVLFLSQNPLWPLDQGYRIRGYHMATTLAQSGVRTAVASLYSLPADAPADLGKLAVPWTWPSALEMEGFESQWSGPLSWLRTRLADHQGLNPVELAGVLPLVRSLRPRVVVGLGQHGPMILHSLRSMPGLKRVWYAADELVRFHLSCLRSDRWSEIPSRLRRLAVCAGIEAHFARGLDGAIGVSPRDTTLLRRLAGVKDAITIRNGVDLAYFHPTHPAINRVRRRSLVFWGKLDFEPNIDAIRWFARRVWPRLRAHHSDATWKIVGRNPTLELSQLAAVTPGMDLVGGVDDVRPYAWHAALVILPMRRGGGIKNKLLEAAAMARPIVASPKTLEGLDYDLHYPPAWVCRSDEQWIQTILELWVKDAARAEMGLNALNWVRSHHTWRNAGRSLLSWLNILVGRDLRAAPACLGSTAADDAYPYSTEFLQRWAA